MIMSLVHYTYTTNIIFYIECSLQQFSQTAGEQKPSNHHRLTDRERPLSFRVSAIENLIVEGTQRYRKNLPRRPGNMQTKNDH